MSEFDRAVKFVNEVLDRPSGDPDDNVAVLARQFLRAVDRDNMNKLNMALDESSRSVLQDLRKASA